MAFKIYLQKNVGNEISGILNIGIKEFTVTSLSITDGLLKKGNYQIPIEHILFIEEV